LNAATPKKYFLLGSAEIAPRYMVEGKSRPGYQGGSIKGAQGSK